LFHAFEATPASETSRCQQTQLCHLIFRAEVTLVRKSYGGIIGEQLKSSPGIAYILQQGRIARHCLLVKATLSFYEPGLTNILISRPFIVLKNTLDYVL
jgi:hypothetical protein